MSKPLTATLDAITNEPGTERNKDNLLTSVGRVANYIRLAEASRGFLPREYASILQAADAAWLAAWQLQDVERLLERRIRA